jgi:tetratricopeptide (TPR) repeat protein
MDHGKDRSIQKYPKNDLLAVFGIVFLGVLIYANTFSASFHFDDFKSIAYNPTIRNILDLRAIWNFWPTRFINYFSFALNYHFHNFDVFGYHFFNLLVHLGASLLVWRLAYLTFLTPCLKNKKGTRQAGLVAFFAGLIFVAHPIQTQAVTYIVQRTTSLAAFFYLASLVLYVQSRLFSKEKPGYKKTQAFYYYGSLLSAILAMFTKEMTITLPFMILLYEVCFLKNGNRMPWKTLAPFLITFIVIPLTMVLTRSVNFAEMRRVPETLTNISSAQYLLTQFRVFLTYIRLLLLPIHQNLDYDYPLAKTLFEFPVLASLFLILIILVVAIRRHSQYPLLSFGILWFFMTLLPESSLVPIKEVINEHRLYLPMAGYSFVIATGLFYLFQNKTIKFSVLLLSLLAFCYAVMTYNRNNVWKDELTLWSDVILRSPQKERGYDYRGNAYYERRDLDHAISDYNRAVEINPKSPEAYNNRGTAYQAMGDLDKAISDYSKAILITPEDGDIYFNRGNAYRDKGELDRAIADYRKAIENKANYDGLYFNLGNAWKDKGELAEAILNYSKTIEMNPTHTGAYNNRAVAYFLTKQYAKSWQDIHKLRSLGADINPGILKKLEAASMAEDEQNTKH